VFVSKGLRKLVCDRAREATERAHRYRRRSVFQESDKVKDITSTAPIAHKMCETSAERWRLRRALYGCPVSPAPLVAG
jgi:hypothetical protein